MLKIGPSGWGWDVLNEAGWRNPAWWEHQPPKLMIANHSSTRTCSSKIFGKGKGGRITKSSLEIPPAVLLVSNAGEVCTAASCQGLLPCLQASTMKDPGRDCLNVLSHQGYLSLSASFQLFPLYSNCRSPASLLPLRCRVYFGVFFVVGLFGVFPTFSIHTFNMVLIKV